MNEQEVELNQHQGIGATVTRRTRTGRQIRTRFHHDGTEIRNYSVENAAQVEEAATSAVEENNNVNHKSNNCS